MTKPKQWQYNKTRTQEAYRPPRGKYTLCCSGWEYPPPPPPILGPDLDGGGISYPGDRWGTTLCCSGWEYPPPPPSWDLTWMGGISYPGDRWGTTILPNGGATPSFLMKGSSHPSQWGVPHPSWQGVPPIRPGKGYPLSRPGKGVPPPPHPDLGWGTPQSRAGKRVPHQQPDGGTPPPPTMVDKVNTLPSVILRVRVVITSHYKNIAIIWYYMIYPGTWTCTTFD